MCDYWFDDGFCVPCGITNQSGRGVKALPVKNDQAMKRKSIYKILWRVLLLCLAWRFTSVAGAGTAITAYIVFVPPVSCSGSAFSPLYALGVALLFLLLLSLLIL